MRLPLRVMKFYVKNPSKPLEIGQQLSEVLIPGYSGVYQGRRANLYRLCVDLPTLLPPNHGVVDIGEYCMAPDERTLNAVSDSIAVENLAISHIGGTAIPGYDRQVAKTDRQHQAQHHCD